MTEPIANTPTAGTAAPRPSLKGTLLNVAVVAAVAVTLVWSALFLDLLSKRGDAATPAAAPAAQGASPGAAQPAQTPAPVTTRSS